MRDGLTATDSLTREFQIAEVVIAFQDVARHTLNMVRQAKGLANRERRCIVLRLVSQDQAPFRLFRTVGPFGIRRVQVNAVRTNQFVHSVRVRGRFVFDARFNDPVVRYYRVLVIAVRGVSLGTFSSRINGVATGILRVAVRNVVADPGGSACVFKDYVVCRFFRVGVFRCLRRVHLRISYPAFVGSCVFCSIYEDRVGVYFVDQVVCSNSGVGTVRIPIVPPVPYRFAKFSP